MHPIDQHESPCCHKFLAVTQSYHIKVNQGKLNAEKIAETVVLFVFTLKFPASLFKLDGVGPVDNRPSTD